MTEKEKRTPGQEAAAFSLLNFLGYKNIEGEYWVSKRFSMVTKIFPSYRAIFEDPDVKGAFLEVMPEEEYNMLEKMYLTVRLPNAWRTFWYPEWEAALLDEIPAGIQGKKPLTDVVNTLRDRAQTLKSQYPE